MDVKDYSQQLSKVKERYQDAANDIRNSSQKRNDNLQEVSDHKIQKQAENYDRDKSKMEEDFQKSNEFFTEKTRDTIGRRQEDYLKKLGDSTSEFEKEKNTMKQKFQDKLSDVTHTYEASANENNRIHEQSKSSLNNRYEKNTDDLTKDFNNKLNKFSQNAHTVVENEKAIDHDKLKHLENNYNNEMLSLRNSAQEKNFKEVSRLSDDNKKLRESFEKDSVLADEQRQARINDIIKIKNAEAIEGQQNLDDLRKKISSKEAQSQENTIKANIKETKNLEHKYNEDIKSIQRLANQKIQNNGDVEGLKADNRRIQTVADDRIQSLRTKIKEDMETMNENEHKNLIDTKEKLTALKNKYNDDRDISDRERDHDKNKIVQKLNDRNVTEEANFQNQTTIQRLANEKQVFETTKDSKDRLKEQRLEFNKTVSKLNEKNLENLSTLKDDFAKNKTKMQVKNELEFSEEKRLLRDKLEQSLSQKDSINQQQIEDIKKEKNRIAESYEGKLERLVRQNEKEVETLKASNAEGRIKQEQAANFALEMNKQEHILEVKNLRSRYEKVIDKDRVMAEQQINHLVQSYEDQLDRERVAGQKELTLRINEAQMQLEKVYKGNEIEKEAIKSQYEDRLERMRLTSLEQVNSKKV